MFIIVRLLKENISDEAKGLRSGKNLQAKKSLDRLGVVQREVQASVSEVDRTKRVYFSEESDALEVATKAQGYSCIRRYSSLRHFTAELLNPIRYCFGYLWPTPTSLFVKLSS